MFLIWNSTAVHATEYKLQIPHDYGGMSVVAGASGTAARLAVFSIDQRKPRRGRYLSWMVGTASGQSPRLEAPRALDASWSAYDVCQLDPATPAESLVVIHAGGVSELADQGGGSKPLLKATTLLAYARDDALPRLKLCFDLYPGEPPAILVPTLAGTEVWRAKQPRQYVRAHRLGMEADQRLFASPLRGGGDVPAQLVYTRLDLPDAHVVDADGDKRPDVCLCREDRLRCFLQKPGGELVQEPRFDRNFNMLTAEESMDVTLRMSCRLAEVNGDGRIDVVLAKTRFNISDMGATLYIFPQDPRGSFPEKATQTITRKGYFAYQDFFDFDGDGLTDIVAPVASLSWTDIASIYLSRMAKIEFVLYRNQDGKFQDQPMSLHQLRFPIDLKNYQAILGALPQWNVRLRNVRESQSGMRQALFFPERKAVEMYLVDAKDGVARTPAWRHEADLGTELSRLDLDGDGWDEMVFAYPRDPKKSRELLFIQPTSR